MATERTIARCRGILAATNAVCEQRQFRCKRCGASGCNHIERDACSQQGFVQLDCRRCHALGEVEIVYADEDEHAGT